MSIKTKIVVPKGTDTRVLAIYGISGMMYMCIPLWSLYHNSYFCYSIAFNNGSHSVIKCILYPNGKVKRMVNSALRKKKYNKLGALLLSLIRAYNNGT